MRAVALPGWSSAQFRPRLASGLVGPVLALGLVVAPLPAQSQVETLSGVVVGMDTPLAFAHVGLPGASGIDFRLRTAISPTYPIGETHTLGATFEWGASAAGPWAISPDNVKSVPGGMTALFDTGVFHAPADAAFVRLHLYAGGFMVLSGTFEHVSVVPEPATPALWLGGLIGLLGAVWRPRRRHPGSGGG
jgi:hypothetical protein